MHWFVLHKAQVFLNHRLTSAFIALLVESPAAGKETQMGQFVSFFDHVNVNSLLINHSLVIMNSCSTPMLICVSGFPFCTSFLSSETKFDFKADKWSSVAL